MIVELRALILPGIDRLDESDETFFFKFLFVQS